MLDTLIWHEHQRFGDEICRVDQLRGKACRAYNVGSPEAFMVAEVARMVAEASPAPVTVKIAKSAIPGRPAVRYVPDTRRAETELNLRPAVPLASGIRRTMAWHRSAGKG